TKEIVEDTLVDIKFSGISWKGNEGFFYSSYDKPEGSELSAKTDQHKLYYHKVGTPQSQDRLIYGGTPEEKHRYVGGQVSEDENYLFISASVSTSGNKLSLLDLRDPKARPITIQGDADADTYVVDNQGSTLFLVTDRDAPNKKLVVTDASEPGPDQWKDLIPETDHVLTLGSGGGNFFAEYMVDAISKVLQYDYQGQLIREVQLPGVGSAGGFGGKKEDREFYFSFTNYNTPGSIYKYDVASGAYELYWKPQIDFEPGDYVSEQVFYTSNDGTRVPMIIT